MAVGARDHIDKKLAQMYSNVKTCNYETSERVNPEDILRSMSLIALNNRNYLQVSSKKREITQKSPTNQNQENNVVPINKERKNNL